MKHRETKDLKPEKLQVVKEQSTELKERIVSNLIVIYDVIIKLSLLLLCMIIITDVINGMTVGAHKYCEYSAAKDHQLLVEECGLKILIPAQVITPVDPSYETTATGLWGGIFEFPEKSQPVSGVFHISVSRSSQLNKPVTVQLEHCANITNEKQVEYLSFVVAKYGPPF